LESILGVCIFEVSVPAAAAAVEFISPFLSTVFLYLAFASTPALDSQTKQFECIGSLTLIRHVSSPFALFLSSHASFPFLARSQKRADRTTHALRDVTAPHAN
jgi:hypothetical protein